MRMKLVFLLLVLSFDLSASFAMDNVSLSDSFLKITTVSHKTGYSQNYSYVTGDFGNFTPEAIDQQNKKMLENCILKIEEYCPNLPTKILDQLPKASKKRISFLFSDLLNDGTAFVQPNDESNESNERIDVIVNLSKARFEKGQLVSMVPTLNEALTFAGESVAMVYETPSPFWLTIAHELIHLKHWLDEKTNRTSYSFDKAFGGGTEDMKMLSYSSAKETDLGIILSLDEFHNSNNPRKLLALMDDLCANFKKNSSDVADGLVKLFIPFSKEILQLN